MLLNDKQIRQVQSENDLLTPFVHKKIKNKLVNRDENGNFIYDDVISFGLSSAGYDLRLGTVFKRRITDNIDPKNMKDSDYETSIHTEPFYLNPFENILAVSYEYINMPDDLFAIAIGKSTYARSFILANTTPLEPGWKGYLTIELKNLSDKKVKLYPEEGIVQLVFFKLDEKTNTPYVGKYQYQAAIPTVSKVGL